MKKEIFLFLLISIVSAGWAGSIKVILNEEEFKDRVYACWFGKVIGGTLGMPYEGQREMHNLSFYEPVPKEPVPNDDLDLQLLWLKALEDNGPKINAHILGKYWLKYVIVDWNEYGIGKRNIRLGIPPPLSGHFRNIWKDSNGAWIRSEIWACLYPGVPTLAARYAFEDACVDHGIAEGTYAEVFIAVLESCAFVEKDKEKLLDIALSYIPANCYVARSVRVAMDCWKKGLDWRTARERVVEASKETGWFMAPQNIGFVVIGLLYGGDDFGKAICTAVNCGDDSDCTGATVGSIMGILYGTKGIPQKWRKPVSEELANVAIGGFKPPSNIRELTDRVVKMAKIALRFHNAPVYIQPQAPTTINPSSKLKLPNKEAAASLWARTPYQIFYEFPNLEVCLDYMGEPVLESGKLRDIKLSLRSKEGKMQHLKIICQMEKEVNINPRISQIKLPGNIRLSLRAKEIEEEAIRGKISFFTRVGRLVGEIPLFFIGRLTVHKDDFALANYGVRAESDSELSWEKGCTGKVNDGIIAGEDDFEGRRWHSALTPHPHWVILILPEKKVLGRVIIHFADPRGYPVDFDGEVSVDGKEWRKIFSERNYQNPRRYERSVEPTPIKYFRFIIYRSASRVWENAAQISEIELLPK